MNFELPELGEGVYEAEVVQWLVKVGQKVQRGQGLLQVLTDKATMEVPAPFAGTITELLTQPGEKVRVGQVILAYQSIENRLPIETPKATSKKVASVAVNGAPHSDSVVAAPSVRHLARKLGLDLKSIRGSGPAGRILLDDLTPVLRSPTPEKPAPTPTFDLGTPGTRIKLVGVRRLIAEHMVHSSQTIPHYSYVDECEVTELVRLRDSLREKLTAKGVKLTYLAFFMKAVVDALKAVPMVNSSLDESSNEIAIHDHYHIGFAVATPQGLIVPVIRDADQKDVFTIAQEIDRLSLEARAGKSKLDELRGGTFTITSVGNIGGLIATPIIHQPQVGILGLGKIVKRPVYDEAGNIRPAEMMYLSFSFDHRIVDGAIGAVFGNAIIQQIQRPAALLLPEKWG